MDTIVLEVDRHLRIGMAEARALLVRALRAQDFTITSEQVATVTAKRGSQLMGSVQPKKLPLHIRVVVQPEASGCVLRIQLADAWRSGVGKVWGMNGPYRSVLQQIQQELDAALRPAAAEDAVFSSAEVVAATADIGLLSRSNEAIGQAGGLAANRVEEALDHQPSSTPRALEEIALRGPGGVATFDRQGVEGLLTVALLVSRSPGSMPPNLARDVEAFSARLEAAISAQPRGRVLLDVAEPEAPVVEFLARQAEIRERVPLRTLQTCTTCKLERVVNPDFKRLQAVTRRCGSQNSHRPSPCSSHPSPSRQPRHRLRWRSSPRKSPLRSRMPADRCPLRRLGPPSRRTPTLGSHRAALLRHPARRPCRTHQCRCPTSSLLDG